MQRFIHGHRFFILASHLVLVGMLVLSGLVMTATYAGAAYWNWSRDGYCDGWGYIQGYSIFDYNGYAPTSWATADVNADQQTSGGGWSTVTQAGSGIVAGQNNTATARLSGYYGNGKTYRVVAWYNSSMAGGSNVTFGPFTC